MGQFRSISSVAFATMLGVASLPSFLGAQRALVYCPADDQVGCNNVVLALTPLVGTGSLQGVDRLTFTGSQTTGTGTINGTTSITTSSDLSSYAVVVVPSLADRNVQGSQRRPYAGLRNALVAARLKAALTGRVAGWSGAPDLTPAPGNGRILIQNLVVWAKGGTGTGLVFLVDNTSVDISARYSWLNGVAGVSVGAELRSNGNPICNPSYSVSGSSSNGRIATNAGSAVGSAILNGLASNDEIIGECGFAPGPQVDALGIVGQGSGASSTQNLLVSFRGPAVQVNEAPELAAIANQAVPEGQTFSITASATDDGLPSGSALVYSLTTKPSNATIDAATGQISWPTGESDGGTTASFTVQVTDGSLTDSKAFTVTVTETNQAPTLSGVPATETVNEGTELTFTAVGSDTDVPPQSLTYSLQGTIPDGAAIDASTGAFSWTPTEEQGPGEYTFKVRVSDGSLNTEQTITITVNEANAAPVWATIEDKNVDEKTLLSFTVSATDSDLPANTLTYNVVGSLPTGATFDADAKTFSWTPTEAQGPMSVDVTLRVSDGTENVDETFTINVAEVNEPPVLAAIGSQTIDEMVAWSGVSASASDPDLPSNTLTYALSTKPSGMTIDATTGAISWTPSETQDGTHSVTVDVSDGKGGTDSETFQVTVREVNVAPTLGAIAARSVDEGSPLTFAATATDPDVVSGAAQTLTFSLGTLPSGVTGTAAISAAGVFTWTPTDDNPTTTPSDEYDFIVRVSDGVAPLVAGTAKVTVNNVAPVITSAAVNVPLAPVGYPAAVTASVDFTDVGTGDTHVASVQWDAGLPFETNGTSGTTVSISGGKITASKSLPAGIYTVTLKVVDDDTGMAMLTAVTYVVVFDPNGGFTTGGGWFTADADDCLTSVCNGATGKAHFGFVSKYTPGKTVPTGNTEFQFQAGNLKFHSTAYNALVVSGNRAQYWGTGMVNGMPGYTFRLTAVDGQVAGNEGTVDKFRIEIWQGGTWQANQPMGGTRIFDNQWGQAQEAQLSTAIEGGSITIKTK